LRSRNDCDLLRIIVNAKNHVVRSVELLSVLLAACLLAGCHSPDGAARSEKDLARLRANSDHGNVEAQFELGKMYANGDGVPRNDEEALKWFQLAAAQGHANAQYYLGLMYKDGQGTEKNFVEAYKWLSLSAVRGSPNAEVRMNELGRLMSREQIAEAQRAAMNFTAEKRAAQPVEKTVEKPVKKLDRETKQEPVFSPVPPSSSTEQLTEEPVKQPSQQIKEESVFSPMPPPSGTNQPAWEPVKTPKRKAKKEPVFSPVPPPSGP
jgi:TPR repeat protein